LRVRGEHTPEPGIDTPEPGIDTPEPGIDALVGTNVLVGTPVETNKRTGWNKRTDGIFCQKQHREKTLENAKLSKTNQLILKNI